MKHQHKLPTKLPHSRKKKSVGCILQITREKRNWESKRRRKCEGKRQEFESMHAIITVAKHLFIVVETSYAFCRDFAFVSVVV